MKAATIYERRGKIYVHSSSKTTAGVWIVSEPVLVIDSMDSSDLGKAIRVCLSSSLEGISHPSSFTGIFDPVLKASGVKSYATFVNSAKCVEVESDDSETVRMIATRNEGLDDGFVPMLNKMNSTKGPDRDIGEAALFSLSMCE